MFDPIANKKVSELKVELGNLEQEINKPISKKYYEVEGDKKFTVYLPLGDGNYGGYSFEKETNDDFIKLIGLDTFFLSEYTQEQMSKPYDDTKDGVMITSADNHYATTIGTKVLFTFTGTDIYMNHYADSRGGMWEVYIDGHKRSDITTYSSSPTTKRVLLADNLTPTEHKVTLVFVGEDPSNPVESPRGWIRYGGHTKSFEYTNTEPQFEMIKKIEMIRPGSNIEYAITVSNEEDTETEWIPEHNQVGTVFLSESGMQSLLIDDKEVDISLVKGLTSFRKCELIQILECKLPSDTSNRAFLKIKMEFTDVMSQYFEMEFMKNSIVKAGYVFQMPMSGDFLSKIKTDKRDVMPANYESVGGTEITYADNLDTNSFVATSDNYPDYYLENTIENRSRPLTRLWLQHRSTELQKLYPQVFSGGSGIAVEKGFKLYFDGYYKIGRLKNANKVYS